MMHSMNTAVLHKSISVATLLVACLALGACRHGPAACTKPGVYAEAQSVPPLRIPTGLQAPDTRGALRIPELTEPEAPRAADSPCLDQPPRYAPNARLVTPEAEKKAAKKAKKGAKSEPAPAAPPASAPPPAPSR